MEYKPNLVTVDGCVKRIWYITIATKKHPNLDILQEQCNEKGINLIVLAMGDNRLTSREPKLWGVRLQYVHKFANDLCDLGHDDDLILFTDSYDILLISDMYDVINKYQTFASDIVFSSESNCYPEKNLADKYPKFKDNTYHRYLNGGGYIGRCDTLRDYLSKYHYELDYDDQLYWSNIYINECASKSRTYGNKNAIVLDTESAIFHSMHDSAKEIKKYVSDNNRFVNEITGTYPSFLHFNGSKSKFNDFYRAMKDDSDPHVPRMTLFDTTFEKIAMFICSILIVAIIIGVTLNHQNVSNYVNSSGLFGFGKGRISSNKMGFSKAS